MTEKNDRPLERNLGALEGIPNLTQVQQQLEMSRYPPAQAVTLILEYIDGTLEDWHFPTPREAKDFILAVQAAKMGYGDSWMLDIFKISLRPYPFLPSIN